ncbi:hypothetical protein ABIB35_002219 [Arthrobacter sp. UYP6]
MGKEITWGKSFNAALSADPGNTTALALLGRTAAALSPAAGAAPDAPARQDAGEAKAPFDWDRAEADVGSDVPPPFVAEPQPGQTSRRVVMQVGLSAKVLKVPVAVPAAEVIVKDPAMSLGSQKPTNPLS